jgi:ribosome-associated translation inhibitor RaiA
MTKRIAFFLVVGSALAAVASAREGFGFTKRATEFTKTVPPAVNVSGTRVNVTAASRPRFADKAELLRKYTEEAITASNRMQIASPGDVNVAIDLDKLEVRTHTDNKVETHYNKEKDKNGKTTYKEVPETKSYTVVNSEIAGGYKITDNRGGELDSGNFDDSSEKEYEYVTPKEEVIQETFLRAAARKIAARIAPTTRKVRVIMPKGSFESYIPLAESGAWDKYLQAVEAVPAMSDRGSEAYRQYALGLAKEAVAYSTDDPKRAIELLHAAADHYRAAIAGNPNEKLFSEGYSSLLDAASAPVPRVEASMKAYEAWTGRPTPAKPASASMASGKASQSSSAMRNENVIDMAKAGVAEENIVMAIDSAEAAEFDTTPNGLIALSKGGVSKNVIAHIQKRKK